ncbi:peptidylprolyl isomerase [Thermodesulfobacteriota bacterium]
MRATLPIIICMFIVVGFSCFVFAETSNRVMAVVNEDVITLYELNKKIEEMTGQTWDNVRAQDNKKYLETRQAVLDLLINERLTQEKIQELGIQVTQDQIDATIENIKKTNRLTQEDLIEGLKTRGIIYEKYRKTIKKELEVSRLINYEVESKILIREEQIIQYYHKHKDEFHGEAQVHIASIFLKQNKPNDKEESEELTKKCEKILARLRNGEDFGKIAREFSQGPGADEGGDLGKFKTAQIDPGLLKILAELPEGGISDLINRENGIQILKLIKREEAGTKPFDEVRDIIYRSLYNEEVNKRYEIWIKELRENTFIKITF